MLSHPSNARRSEDLKMSINYYNSGIVKVTGPPPNRTLHSSGHRPHYRQPARFSSRNERTFSRSQESYKRDQSCFNDTLSKSFKESCSIQDKNLNARDQKESYDSPYETIRNPVDGYSDYDDWDSDNSSELIQRCFELSQSPPDPHRPDIHSVLNLLLQEQSDENYQDFNENLHGTGDRVHSSGYDYSSILDAETDYSKNYGEGMTTLLSLYFIGEEDDTVDSNPRIPPNDLRHRIGRHTSNQNTGKMLCLKI